MKIFIHTMYFLPEFGSTPVLMQEFASYLAQKGHNVEVITTFPRQNDINYKNKIYLKETKNNFIIKRFWTNRSPSSIGRFIAWNLYAFWSALHALLKVRREDILFLRLPPPQLGFVGILSKKLKGAKFILNVQDIHPDLAIESGVLKNPFIGKLAKAFEKWIYKNSDCITVISDGFKQNLKDKGVPDWKIKVIPNWVDIDFLKPLPKNNEVAKKLALERKFVVMYAGTITLSSFRSLEKIIDAAHLLKDESDIIFAIVGEGMKKEGLIEKAKHLKSWNVKFIPFQAQDDLPYLLASSDVLVVPLDAGKSQLSVPSKLYNFMATGRPILGLSSEDSEITKIVDDSQCGISVHPDDVNEIVKAILNLKNSKDNRETFGHNGRDYTEKNFAKETVLKIYENLIFSL